MLVKRQETFEDCQKSAPQFSKTELEYIHESIVVGNIGMSELVINNNFRKSSQTLATLSIKLNMNGLGVFLWGNTASLTFSLCRSG